MNIWKVILVGAIALVILYWLYPSRSLTLPEGVKEIVMWGPGEELPTMEPVLKRFEFENPEYKVVIGQAAARDMVADPQRFLCSVAGGMPPDIIKFDRYAISEWASRGAFEPLNAYLEADAQNTNLTYRVDTSDIVHPAMDEVTYKGNIYGIPDCADDRFLYYNSDILIREGFVDEQGNAKPPRTWEELEEYAVKLTKHDENGNIKQLGFAPNYGNSWLYMYAWQNGGEFISPNGRVCTMNSTSVVEALDYMTRIYDELGGAMESLLFNQPSRAVNSTRFSSGR